MNLANKVAIGLSRTFGQGLYDMITKLLGIRTFSIHMGTLWMKQITFIGHLVSHQVMPST
jgi:hypothetical protein